MFSNEWLCPANILIESRKSSKLQIAYMDTLRYLTGQHISLVIVFVINLELAELKKILKSWLKGKIS